MPQCKKRVAIIGAGAAGLIAAREAIHEGLQIVVYEGAEDVGGVWIYRSEVEDDLLGQSPHKRIYCSLYESLRTNLPRELMAFSDYPFDSRGGGKDEWPQFMTHHHVNQYLKNFAKNFGVYQHIQFQTKVVRVEKHENQKWLIQLDNGAIEIFDAVMVCNGHYSKPRIATVPGMEHFKGLLMHSHNYRRPKPFSGKRVVVLGAGASGEDISREIALQAKAVYWCAEAFNNLDESSKSTEWPEQRAGVAKIENATDVHLKDGSKIGDVDAFLFCTGYHYEFPFLADGIISVEDNWVHPLYLELIPPEHTNIAFIGLPHSVIPFPLFEMQSKWYLRRLSGRFEFPSMDTMSLSVAQQETTLREEGRPQRHYHKMGDEQFAYINLLATQCGANPLPDWFETLAHEAREKRNQYPHLYRDLPLKNTPKYHTKLSQLK
ncbi:NAD(P)-binding domain-containing protein [Rubellicoccus peritrichatus]|uniref:Trimethylamine monooxygenase n=1 Tax=Rubellicoccus peritrichatus TaxID=3080537 RepID=A0AAQ3QWD7_9BACT|nr:NAD(P)-binding domain-containing protein [Puniceicoccus sp. CR14]WOO41775.1 NAD(P)-binding domain-containing protein [Puniceicoccus sp. CR14]